MYTPLINAVILAEEMTVDEYDAQLFEIIIPFAQSDDGKITVSIVSQAKLANFEDRNFYEFSFHISVMPDPDDPAQSLEIWAPGSAANYIPKENRNLLLATVCECYKALVQKIDKAPIYRVSYAATEEVPYRNQLLTTTLENAGYEVEETGTDAFGRTFWMMVPSV